jgi:hypothetical protein
MSGRSKKPRIKIRVTAAMLDAGFDAYYARDCYDCDNALGDRDLEAIYRAMRAKASADQVFISSEMEWIGAEKIESLFHVLDSFSLAREVYTAMACQANYELQHPLSKPTLVRATE